MRSMCMCEIIPGSNTTEKNIMEQQIRDKLEDMRQHLQGHGGDMEVVSIEGTDVNLRLKGACGGCPHAVMTIKNGIEQALRDEIDKSIVVNRVE